MYSYLSHLLQLFLFPVEFVDKLILVCNFIIQVADLVVTFIYNVYILRELSFCNMRKIHYLDKTDITNLLDNQLQIFNLLLEIGNLSLQLLLGGVQLLEFLLAEVPPDPGLQPCDNFSQSVITHFFKTTQDTGTEEYLCKYVRFRK
ncbi:UNVERIFIED_CONTAM: hypothetical protein NCL1_15808 [Trichonephila clavipes]